MTRDNILDAAVEEAEQFGIKGFSVERLARRVGLSRTTIYRHFPNKDAIVSAMATREIVRIFERITNVVDQEPTVEDQLVEGFAAIVHAARGNQLIKRTLAAEPEVAMRLASDGAILDVGRAFVAARLEKRLSPTEVDAVAEVIVRVGFTFVVMQDGGIQLSSANEARAFARRFLVPMLAS